MHYKKFFYLILIAFSLSCAAQEPPVTPAAASPCGAPLSIGWTDYPPYQYAPQHSPLTPIGAEIEFINRIGKNLHCTFTFKKIPFARQLPALAAGDIDIIFSAKNDSHIQSLAWVSKPFREEIIQLFVRRNEVSKFHINTLADLKGTQLLLGTKKGAYYGDEYEQAMQDPEIAQRFDPSNQNVMTLKKLVYGRIDGVLLETSVERELTKRLGYEELVAITPFILYKGSVHILFNKNKVSPQLVDLFNQQISLLQQNNTIQEINEKYKITAD